MSAAKAIVNVRPGGGTVLRYRQDAQLTVKASAADTGGAFDCAEFVVHPKAGPPEHRHPYYDELFVVLEGTLIFKVDGVLSTCAPGSVIYVPGGVAHTYQMSSERDGRLLVTFSPGGYLEFFEALAQLPPGPPDLAAMTAVAARFNTEVVGPALMAS